MTENESNGKAILTTNDAAILETIAEEEAIFHRRVQAYTKAMSDVGTSKVLKQRSLANLRSAGVALRTSLRTLNQLSKVK